MKAQKKQKKQSKIAFLSAPKKKVLPTFVKKEDDTKEEKNSQVGDAGNRNMVESLDVKNSVSTPSSMPSCTNIPTDLQKTEKTMTKLVIKAPEKLCNNTKDNNINAQHNAKVVNLPNKNPLMKEIISKKNNYTNKTKSSNITIHEDDSDDELPLSSLKKKLNPDKKSLPPQNYLSINPVQPPPITTSASPTKITAMTNGHDLNISNAIKKIHGFMPTTLNVMPSQIQSLSTLTAFKSPIKTTLKPPVFHAIPPKSVVIAIDMDSTKWKTLSSEAKSKIIEEKKEIARKTLLSLNTINASKPVTAPVQLSLLHRPSMKPFANLRPVFNKPLLNIRPTAPLPPPVFTPIQRLDDSQLADLTPLPTAKKIEIPDNFPTQRFGDVIMLVEFINTFKKFLQAEDSPHITAVEVMKALTGSGETWIISKILLLFLKVLLGNEDYKIHALKLELADLPLTEYTVSYLMEQYIKSQLEKKRKQVKISLLQDEQAEDEAYESDGSRKSDDLFVLSDDEDEQKKKKAKRTLLKSSLEYTLNSICLKLKQNEFISLPCNEQLLVLTHLVGLILESEEFSSYFDELESEKTSVRRELEKRGIERVKKEQSRAKKIIKDPFAKFTSCNQNKDTGAAEDKSAVEEKPAMEETKNESDTNSHSGLTSRQLSKTQNEIDAIRKEDEKKAQLEEEIERAEIETLKKQEAEYSTKLQKLNDLCKSSYRASSLGSDRFHRMYWTFPNSYPGLLVNIIKEKAVNATATKQYESWEVYNCKEDIDKLTTALTIRGIREVTLKHKIKESYNIIMKSLEKSTSSKPISDEQVDDCKTTQPAEQIVSSIDALKIDLIESANRIVHGSLGEILELDNWIKQVNEVTDPLHMKDFILQLQSCVLPKFLGVPFDSKSLNISTAWCNAVLKAFTMSKLHTLFGILENSILWEKSSEHLRCKVCRKKKGSGLYHQLIICDECNNPYHSQCIKPPLLSIPSDSWKCPNCIPRKERYSRNNKQSYNEEGSNQVTNGNNIGDTESEDDDSEHEAMCHVCETDGILLLCDTCPLSFHLACHVPPLRAVPKGSWHCYKCRTKKTKRSAASSRQQSGESDSDTGSDDDFVEKKRYDRPKKKLKQNKKEKSDNLHRKKPTPRKKKKTDTASETTENNVKKQPKKRSARKVLDMEDKDDSSPAEVWDSVSPVLGNKRPRYTKDCTRQLNYDKRNASNKTRQMTSSTTRSRSNRNRGRNSEEMKICKKILDSLRQHSDAWPMDDFDDSQISEETNSLTFSQVLKKIDTLMYEDILQLAEDVNHLFDTSPAFKQTPETEVAGKNLKTYFQSLLKDQLPEVYSLLDI